MAEEQQKTRVIMWPTEFLRFKAGRLQQLYVPHGTVREMGTLPKGEWHDVESAD